MIEHIKNFAVGLVVFLAAALVLIGIGALVMYGYWWVFAIPFLIVVFCLYGALLRDMWDPFKRLPKASLTRGGGEER